MRIQHNIASLNSYRNLMGNNSNIAKNLEKLSSGYRINKAGDDAAGLAISEKMRSQITGLETATKNANDGISLVQTIEGALTETHAILNRLIELTTQSANGVYDDDTDRASIQDEANSLLTEIDRIGDSTDFNKIHVLNASAGGLEANPEELKSYIIKGLKGGWLEKSADIIKEAYGYDITKTGPKPNIGKLTLQFKPDMDSAVASVGGSSDGLNLNINMKAFQDLTGVDGMPKNDPGKTMKYMTADRVIAHEMTHAAMDVYFGENGAGMNALHEMNHIWFIEGTAEAVAGADERVKGTLANSSFTGADSNKIDAMVQSATDMFKNGKAKLDSDGYSTGYKFAAKTHMLACGMKAASF